MKLEEMNLKKRNEHSKYFFCYDHRLKDYLLERGERYICTAYSTDTLNRFWLFETTEELIFYKKEYYDWKRYVILEEERLSEVDR